MKTLFVKCPQCKELVKWDAKNSHKPFCSERCKLIDLGAWANDEHRIVGTAVEVTHDKEELN